MRNGEIIMSFLKKKWMKKNAEKKQSSQIDKKDTEEEQSHHHLLPNLLKNVEFIKALLGNSSDLVYKNFQTGENSNLQMGIFFIDGLADKQFVHEHIIESLLSNISSSFTDDAPNKQFINLLFEHFLTTAENKKIADYKSLFSHLLSGDTILLIDGYKTGIAIGSRGYADRGVQEPSSQTVVRGPKDGFTETLRTNTSLIRRRIKNPNLWIESMKIGEKTNTDVAVVYLKGVAQDKIVDEVLLRLKKIDVDKIIESGNVEECIQDNSFTVFPTVFNTERPDVTAAAILEGRVAILVDGTPFVLIVPALFVQFFQSNEDYYQRADIGSLVRVLRYFSFFLALLTPSAYIAVTTFHQEMLPTPLLISLTSQREGIPFPAVIEAILMEIIFEILREAGIRMPRAVGSAISIVGALVIGEAAVSAGIISSAMVIVVSLTAISSFVAPAFNMGIAVRILRFGFMILAATFGMFGIMLGVVLMVLHLCSLRSFGVPYLAPFAPLILTDQKDAMLRFPFWAMFSRPRLINQKDITREKTPKPKPEQKAK